MSTPISTLAGLLAMASIAGASANAAENAIPPYIRVAVASPFRPADDTKRDASQKPAEVLAFAGVKPGDHIAYFWPAPPYSTGLLSLVAGSKGHVYAIVPTKLPKDIPQAESDLKQALAPYGDVTQLVQPFDAFDVPEQLDVGWMGKIYHDFPNTTEMGPNV